MYNIFKVIYSPRQAFKEIAQTPTYIGPLLIMALFIVASIGGAYIAQSKIYDEEAFPQADLQKDEWTEKSILWGPSNANISESDDHLIGDYYGNKSIEFSVINDRQVWMNLNLTEPIACLSSDGYKTISFKIKLVYPATTVFTSVILLLMSNETNSFQYNFTQLILSVNNTWNNITIALGQENGWVGDADWGNITRLAFNLTWSENANLTVRLDCLFFRGVFKSVLENPDFNTFLVNVSLYAFTQFVATWVILSGIIFVISKLLGANIPWKNTLVVIGFVLMTFFIQAIINITTTATISTLHRPLEFFGGTENESRIAQEAFFENLRFAYQLNGYIQIAILFWTIVLCALAIRSLTEFTWDKNFLIAFSAYFITTLISMFIPM